MDLLCIDDHLDDLMLFSEAVKTIDPNCSCIMTTSGEEGLSMLATMEPDYIFLDINMPRLNGKKILKAIRQNHTYDIIKICILSTSITSAESKMYNDMGANYCLTKPSSFDKLITSLAQIFSADAQHCSPK